ncbi:NAD(P)-dependent oxidoreductase, partial [Pseudomonas aeruginosa]|uniref:NAD(P)-dependent oxidoreductase n=1 Tax=Pseudomonas aeruginosa TaxID=287 RepID=UPI0031B73028
SQAKVMLAGIDTLWHCSSFTSPWGTQQAFDLANVRATRRLGEWAVAWGVRNFIHISSTVRRSPTCAAGLDVFEQEPLSVDSPLLSMANVVALPH